MPRSAATARKRKGQPGDSGKNKKKKANDSDNEKSKEESETEISKQTTESKVADNLDKSEEVTNSSNEKNIAANGKEWNLKIMSWNINGVRAWVEHNGIDYVKSESPDIFCCQETKCEKTKIPLKAGIKDYHSYWLSGDKDGYSGVGLLTKIKPLNVTYGINDPKFDTEGRVVTAEYENFFLINSYIPNSGRGLVRLEFRLEWENAFLKYLKELDSKKPIIWCGDLNVAHNKIDLKNPDTNTKTAGFTKEERECFSKLLSEGFIDSFRYLYPNKEGAYTFWSYFKAAREKNVGWRLDYFVVSERLKEKIAESNMKSDIKGSDHCPIVLQISI